MPWSQGRPQGTISFVFFSGGQGIPTEKQMRPALSQTICVAFSPAIYDRDWFLAWCTAMWQESEDTDPEGRPKKCIHCCVSLVCPASRQESSRYSHKPLVVGDEVNESRRGGSSFRFKTDGKLVGQSRGHGFLQMSVWGSLRPYYEGLKVQGPLP